MTSKASRARLENQKVEEVAFINSINQMHNAAKIRAALAAPVVLVHGHLFQPLVVRRSEEHFAVEPLARRPVAHPDVAVRVQPERAQDG